MTDNNACVAADIRDNNVPVKEQEAAKTVGKKKVKIRVKEMTFIAMMGALSSILIFFRFPLPFLPPFLSFDVSPIIEMIGGFMYGPVAALLIIILKILLQLVMQGSHSVGTGELQNLILGCAYVMPALLFYRKKTKKRAAIGMAAGTATVSIVSVFSNLYLIIPFYVALFGMTMEDIVAMCTEVNPAVTNAFTMVLFGIVPFNLIKYGLCSVLTFFLYKRLSKPIKNFINR